MHTYNSAIPCNGIIACLYPFLRCIQWKENRQFFVTFKNLQPSGRHKLLYFVLMFKKKIALGQDRVQVRQHFIVSKLPDQT